MTLAEFAAANPDLENNWVRANDPANASDPNAAWILSFGSLENYQRSAAQMYGVQLTTPTTGGGTTTTTRAPRPPWLAGYTAEGYEVYHLIDQAGWEVEWWDMPGRGAQAQHYVSDAQGAPFDPSYIGKRVTVATPTPTPTQSGSDKTAIWAAVIGALGLWLASRRK